MVEVSASRDTGAPVPAVWDVLMQPVLIPEWNTLHAGFTGDIPDRLMRGGGYTERFSLMGMTIVMDWAVVELVEPELIEMVGKGPAGLTITNRYELHDVDGLARLTMRSRFSGGPADTPFAPMIGKIGQNAADRAVERLAMLIR